MSWYEKCKIKLGEWFNYLFIAGEPALDTQFFVTISATFRQIDEATKQQHQQVTDRIVELLDSTKKTWSNAYEIERLLVKLYEPEFVEIELNRRLVEADLRLFKNESQFFRDEKAAADTPEKKQALLNRLLNDLQWRYTIKEQKSAYARLVQARTMYIFLISLFIFLLTGLFGFGYSDSSNSSVGDIYFLTLSLTAGLWGASFSQLIGLRNLLQQSTFDNLKVFRRWVFLGSRAVIGIGAACILFVFLQARILSGHLFPQFVEPTYDIKQIASIVQKAAPIGMRDEGYWMQPDAQAALAQFTEKLTKDKATSNDDNSKELQQSIHNAISELVGALPLSDDEQMFEDLSNKIDASKLSKSTLEPQGIALLIVWAFLAGFSETLVPNLLSKTEKSVESDNSS